MQVPLTVYVPAATDAKGFVPIATYGESFKKRRPVRLLYINGNHYDLLL